MKSNNRYLIPLLAGSCLALGIFLGGKLRFNGSSTQLFSSNTNKDKLNRLIDYIDREYVDDIDTDSVVDLTVNNILGHLDPHSVYIPKEDIEEVTESMKGDFVGIGVNFYMYRDTLAVIRTIPNSPSESQGIRAGDRIMIADMDTLHNRGIHSTKIADKLKGPEGTSVKLHIYRKHTDDMFKVDVERAHIPLPSVDYFYMMSADMGYIKVNRFAETTHREFKKALSQLQKKGAKKLTLDLRDNPGGYLNMAEFMADEFLKDGQLILFTKNKRGEMTKTFATKRGAFEDNPIYVLINERSASASEIVAGALQDNDLGTIVGRRSFGKGLVQREMELGDGSSVRLTVSRYYTPTGRSIQRDYTNGAEDYYHDFTKRYYNGELFSVDSIKVADSLKFSTPKGKIVYGGGGIVPDVFVPLGSNEEEILQELEDYGFFSFFIFEYLDRDRDLFKNMSEDEFLSQYTIDDILFEELVDRALAQKVNMDFYLLEDDIKRYLKAAIATQVYGPNSYGKIIGKLDPMLLKVLDLEAQKIGVTAME